MSVATVTSTSYRPFFQAMLVPAKLILAVFLKALGYLLSFFGAKEWGEKLQVKGAQIDSSCTSLLTGLWAYGRRFLVHGDNFEHSCRGSSYWFIYQHLTQKEKPLTEIAKAFADGAPQEAIRMHKNNEIPRGLIETKLWTQIKKDRWPYMPQLDRGVYTFLIGYSKNENTHLNAHRITFIKEEELFLFDPDTGLSKWEDSDWEPLLNRIAKTIKTEPFGYFTIECYSYQNPNR